MHPLSEVVTVIRMKDVTIERLEYSGIGTLKRWPGVRYLTNIPRGLSTAMHEEG